MTSELIPHNSIGERLGEQQKDLNMTQAVLQTHYRLYHSAVLGGVRYADTGFLWQRCYIRVPQINTRGDSMSYPMDPHTIHNRSNISVFLHNIGIGLSGALRIHKQWSSVVIKKCRYWILQQLCQNSRYASYPTSCKPTMQPLIKLHQVLVILSNVSISHPVFGDQMCQLLGNWIIYTAITGLHVPNYTQIRPFLLKA